ncbi:hypothetical protein [Reichenbachiella sp.]|uniref:hypothetical protein n=1 Tax=Reichenbachiella sp. TaxID=2184521 RepID=UPI003297141A
MKTIAKPIFDVAEIFTDCISIVRSEELKNRLTACVDLIVEASDELDSKVSTGNVHTIVTEKIVNNNLTAKELEKVYSFRMVKKDTPGRKYYDKIISAPVLGICPLCSHRMVETLDHYLPKTEFPRLSTVPLNLIPSCFECNKSKLTHVPYDSNEECLHPYYDNIEDECWLVVEVNQTTPPSVNYKVRPIEVWSDLLNERVYTHFWLLSLNRLYSTQAAVQLSNIALRLQRLFDKSGSIGVKAYLKEEAESRFSVDKNSWQTALYYALCQDDWYCEGGFRLI